MNIENLLICRYLLAGHNYMKAQIAFGIKICKNENSFDAHTRAKENR